jgi:hypothetical protein
MATKKKAKTTAKKARATSAKKAAPRRAAAAGRRPARAAGSKASKTSAKKASVRAKAKAPARAKAKAPARPKAKALARPAARSGAARAKPIQRRDRAGHLEPHYAADLREKAGGHEGEPEGFVAGPRSKDDLVEELGEEFVTEATSAEHEGEDVLDQEVPEERGGPFVQTTGDQEFAHGTDPSNPKGASREPFPRT